jgi:superfamily II DNA or RNA helicase
MVLDYPYHRLTDTKEFIMPSLPMLRLRSYQQEALDAIELALLSHNRVACVLPTGAGKTVLFAHLIAKAHAEGKKALVLVHREELAEQAKTKVHSVAPRLSVGIVKAERNEVEADVIIASVQTLAREERRQSILDAGDIGMVIVDECHHAVARTWIEVLADFGCFEVERVFENDEGLFIDYTPTPCVGFTATMTREDGKGLGDVWETIAYERDILWMIDHGYLTDVRGQSVTVDDLDLATIARSRGDYADGQLGEALIASGAAEVTAEAYWEHAGNRENIHLAARQGVLFAPTVAAAYAFSEAFNAAGIPTATVEGTISSEDRALIYKRYEAGEIRVLANCMVLTEGWDAPWAEVCVIARPTMSKALYTQMVGRVLRPWPGKDEALVLDVVGIAGRHKLQSLTELLHTAVEDGETLAQARLRIDAEQAEKTERQTLRGLIKAQQVELFANSHATWLQTKGGKWFIPATFGLFFLWPALDEDPAGTWRLGYVESKRGGPRKPGWIETGLTLEYAMAWGETLAELDDPTVSLKDRKWRRTKPSQSQIDFALRLKCVTPEMAYAYRKGELSDVISIHLASRQLDR